MPSYPEIIIPISIRTYIKYLKHTAGQAASVVRDTESVFQINAPYIRSFILNQNRKVRKQVWFKLPKEGRDKENVCFRMETRVVKVAITANISMCKGKVALND